MISETEYRTVLHNIILIGCKNSIAPTSSSGDIVMPLPDVQIGDPHSLPDPQYEQVPSIIPTSRANKYVSCRSPSIILMGAARRAKDIYHIRCT